MKLPNQKDVILHALDFISNEGIFDDPYIDKLEEDEVIVVLNIIFKRTKHEKLWEKFKSVESEYSWNKEKKDAFSELREQVSSNWTDL